MCGRLTRRAGRGCRDAHDFRDGSEWCRAVRQIHGRIPVGPNSLDDRFPGVKTQLVRVRRMGDKAVGRQLERRCLRLRGTGDFVICRCPKRLALLAAIAMRHGIALQRGRRKAFPSLEALNDSLYAVYSMENASHLFRVLERGGS